MSRLVHALKMGWIKTEEEKEKERLKKGPKFYMLWETDTGKEDMRRIHDHVSAPKRDLPGHAESYNPPPEYLFDEREEREWHKHKDEPSRRKLHFLPQKFNSLREVPVYQRYVRERFLRCLDLYLCPRAKRMKLTIDAEYLIPKLPSPKDLQPFPTVESMVYQGHTDIIRCVSVEPNGEYIVSGSDDTTVKSMFRIELGTFFKRNRLKISFSLTFHTHSMGNFDWSLHQNHPNRRCGAIGGLVPQSENISHCHCQWSASSADQPPGRR